MAAIALVAHTAAGSPSGSGITTSGIDTAGADFVALPLSRYVVGAGSVHPGDNKSNTFTARTAQNSIFCHSRIYDSIPGTVGSGHAASYSDTTSFPAVGLVAFSGVLQSSPIDAQNGATNDSAMSLQAGSVTPSEDGCLIITSIGFSASNTLSIDQGFTILDQIDFVNGQHFGIAIAYKIQTTAAAVNPTWSWGATSQASAVIAVYKSAGGVPPDPGIATPPLVCRRTRFFRRPF